LLVIILTTLLFVILLTDLVCYVALTPHPGLPPHRSSTSNGWGVVAYLGAYLLGFLRLPYAVLPYIGKLLLCGLLRHHFSRHWHSYRGQALRLVGDVLQLVVGYAVLEVGLPMLSAPMILLAQVAWGSEAVRLLTEKGSSLISAIWQWLPHKVVAHSLRLRIKGRRGILWTIIRRYVAYYHLGDVERLRYLNRCLRQYAIASPALAVPLSYLTGFTIVPAAHSLRGGDVRDVVQGHVFVHRRWTNDPWLLMGLALRRSPWIFDPRYLPRPFAYRSQANPMMTLMVLNHAAVSPPFAWYQWGHQIKAARFELFYIVGAWLRLWNEPPVYADGTAHYDPLMEWLYNRGNPPTTPILQWTDEEVGLDMIERGITTLSDVEIAKRYGYPLKYVQEVLGSRIRRNTLLQLEAEDTSSLVENKTMMYPPDSPRITPTYTSIIINQPSTAGK
jgi:hypothetical protein